MSIVNIRTKLITALGAITGLKVYPYLPSNPNENTFCYIRYASVSHLVSYSTTLSKMDWFVGVMTTIPAGTRFEDAQTLLDTYIDSTGANSVRAAINAITSSPNALLPDASHAHLQSANPVKRYIFNGKPYLGVEMPLEVHTV